MNPSGFEIWDDPPAGIERTPDGPGAPGPATAWIDGVSFPDAYRIELRGASFPTLGGACCLPNMVCVDDLTDAECMFSGGIWQGLLSFCQASPCGAGACCLPGGACLQTPLQSDCDAQNGTFQGSMTQCGQLPDFDMDGSPDVCDPDDDNDGVLDVDDVCPMNTLGLLVDIEGRPRMDLNGDCAVVGLDIPIAVDQLVNQ